jgi:hypothetical protein
LRFVKVLEDAMKPCLALFFAIFFFTPGLLAEKRPEVRSEDGILVFMRGIALSYSGRHAEAQKEFEEYRRAHPDDLLVYLRIGYDRFLGRRSEDISRDEYRRLVDFMNEAIGKYEKIGCSGTDLKSLAGSTLDCPYIGAALYSLRMTLVGKSDSWRKVGKDRDRFLQCAKQSRSHQALFLLGVYEYEPSRQVWPIRFALQRFAHVPTDHAHAVATIFRSLEGEPSPFADDIWFFVFDAECACDGMSGKADNAFVEKYPLKQVFEYLHARYPGNNKLKQFRNK